MAERLADPATLEAEFNRRPDLKREKDTQFMNDQAQVPVRKSEAGKHGSNAEHLPSTYNAKEDPSTAAGRTGIESPAMRKKMIEAGILKEEDL